MAEPTGGFQVIRMYRRGLVGVGQDAMAAVTGSAIGDGPITGCAFQTMVTVDIGLQITGGNAVLFTQPGRLVAWGTGSLGNPARADWRAWIACRYDAMFTMAVRAHGRLNLSLSDQTPVDTGPEILLDIPVALSAGPGNIEVVDRGFAVIRRQYTVGGSISGMAIDTSGGRVYATHSRFAVDTASIDLYRLAVEDFVLLCEIDVFMASATGQVQIKRINTRRTMR
jgi:hypothetical protein